MPGLKNGRGVEFGPWFGLGETKGVPFVFLTGYGDAAMMPIEFRSEAAVLLRDHAVQHRNREHGVDARGHAGQLRRAAFSSGVAGTRPRTFFWFGQMMNQTLNAMISASHMPMPIV
jgi:hypothetical protein